MREPDTPRQGRGEENSSHHSSCSASLDSGPDDHDHSHSDNDEDPHERNKEGKLQPDQHQNDHGEGRRGDKSRSPSASQTHKPCCDRAERKRHKKLKSAHGTK